MLRPRSLAALALALASLCALAPAIAQDSSPEAAPADKAQTAPPSSQRPVLRDPTRPPAWRARRVSGVGLGVQLPPLRLRGRIIGPEGRGSALLEVDGSLHLVSTGEVLTLTLESSAAPTPRRRGAAAPAPARGVRTITLRVQSLDARALTLEIVELGRVLTLR